MLRWIFRLLLAFILVIAVAIGALFFLPGDRVAKLAADQLRFLTGRDVRITGDVSMTLWPVLGARVEGLEVGNAEWSEQGPMLTAKNTSIGIDAAALLTGDIQITHIQAQSPTIRLESRADGRASWQFTDQSGDAQIETTTDPDRAPRSLSIARLEVTDATLIYDAEGSDLVSYEAVDLTLDWPERDGPAKINAALRPAGETVSVDAEIAQFSKFLAGESQIGDVVLKAAGGQVVLGAEMALDGAIAGDISVDIPNTDAFISALNLPAPGLPNGLGQALELDAILNLTSDRRLSLRELMANLGGGNALSGRLDAELNGTPRIDAAFSAGALDLKSALASGDGTNGTAGSSGKAAGSGWSTAPIDASGLSAFNGQIRLNAQSVDLGSLRFGKTSAVLTNDRARMVFDLAEVAAYGGRLNGQFVVNNRNGLSVGGGLSGAGLELQGILSDLAGINRLTGSANANVSFLGVGQSVDAIMNSLSGDGQINTGPGTIQGIDLNRLMNNGRRGGGTTVFDGLTASFAISNGNLRNEDLLMTLPNYEARGSGRIGLGAQDIDYTFVPKALRGNGGKGVAIPVRIRGPWSDPQILPDLEAAIKLNLDDEIEKIGEKAKDEVKKIEDKAKKEIQRKLVGETEENQSIEDKIEEKLEKEIGNRLKKLFD